MTHEITLCLIIKRLHDVFTNCQMGIGLIVALFIFGLVNDIFNLKMTNAFFSLTLAVLMAMATNKSEFGHTAGSAST